MVLAYDAANQTNIKVVFTVCMSGWVGGFGLQVVRVYASGVPVVDLVSP